MNTALDLGPKSRRISISERVVVSNHHYPAQTQLEAEVSTKGYLA